MSEVLRRLFLPKQHALCAFGDLWLDDLNHQLEAPSCAVVSSAIRALPTSIIYLLDINIVSLTIISLSIAIGAFMQLRYVAVLYSCAIVFLVWPEK